ncbi:class I SAM-dependent methyltransferase [Saccharicrinis sp. FJH62]|uniref:class I SAM-dependent methyltransferase n=1 Tax=Saccharicrinis sp. FJH62 TaxID=3344657 RepID=UPI0035D44C98
MTSESDVDVKSRYKISNYLTYNAKVLDTYDNSIWIPIFKLKEIDQSVVLELKDEIDKIHILDIGCATGRLLETLSLAGAKNLYGTDIAPNILKKVEDKAKKQNIHIDLKVADAEVNIPWSDNMFDVVALTGVYHHFIQPERALREIYRVLKRNGRVIVIEPRFPVIIRQILNLYLKFFMHEGDHRFFSPRIITKVSQSVDFKVGSKPNNIARFMVKMVYLK